MMKLSGKYTSKVEPIGLVDFNAKRFVRQDFFEMKRKTEITFEVEETTVWRQGEKKFTAYCPQCQALVEMAAPQFAAMTVGVTEREIFRLIETEEIHFVETGKISVCLISLTNKLKEK